MKKVILILIFLCPLLFSCVETDERVKNITVDELKLAIQGNKNIQILDVRTSKEAENGIIFNAIQISLIDNNFKSKVIESLDNEQPVYVYCRSGNRSKIAANILAENGYNVYNVKGGYVQWKKLTGLD
ncbi:rhodanese-like domain-containing protein [Tenacibaculum agarivorans]|uniref:rhodanese-like domain-containing protein n=1 Tax=Tenacibaculum agarivorans TaxID=1908389 RepID=UPI00094B7C16|nr:rhodanese-like domain-containing protein [Tenacibaculum agarivorans]